jgi:NAD(P)-dependent dehydrogenase (short-subunit alcohol dehydrogenase family)
MSLSVMGDSRPSSAIRQEPSGARTSNSACASVVFTVGAGEGLGAAMTAAKGALLPLVRSLAIELAPRRNRLRRHRRPHPPPGR